VLGKSGP